MTVLQKLGSKLHALTIFEGLGAKDHGAVYFDYHCSYGKKKKKNEFSFLKLCWVVATCGKDSTIITYILNGEWLLPGSTELLQVS